MSAWQSDAGFVNAVDHTLGKEGVFADDKADAGGKTIFGIAQTFHPKAFQKVYDLWALGLHAAAVDDAKQFYYDEFWCETNIIDLADKWIAAELFDTAVNMGPSTAIKLAQKTVNLFRDVHGMQLIKQDGVLGPITRVEINTITNKYSEQFMAWFNYFQGDYYMNKSYGGDTERRNTFLIGWARRLLPPPRPA